MIHPWMPIETAPTDGRMILGFDTREGEIHASCYVMWHEANGWTSLGDTYNIAQFPTHWQEIDGLPVGV